MFLGVVFQKRNREIAALTIKFLAIIRHGIITMEQIGPWSQVILIRIVQLSYLPMHRLSQRMLGLERYILRPFWIQMDHKVAL